MSRQQFFLNSANGQNFATQRNFTRHGYIFSHCGTSQRGSHGCSNRDTSGRTIFWNSAFRNMDMEVEIANTGLAGVVANDFQDTLVSKIHLLRFQAVAFGLFRHEMSLGDLEFFPFGVSRESEYLETILQSRRDRMEYVGSSYKENFRK